MLGELQIEKYVLLQDKKYLERAKNSFEVSLKDNFKNEIATIGLIKVKRLLKNFNFNEKDNANLDAIINDGEYVREAYLEKFKNLQQYGSPGLKKEINKAINENASFNELKIFYISYLIEQGELDTAKAYITEIERNNLENLNISLANNLNMEKMILNLSEYELSKSDEVLTKIENQFLKLNFCEKDLWTRYLHRFLVYKMKDDNLRYMLKNQLAAIDQDFNGDFFFYLLYGDVLHNLGNLNEALDKYNKALKFVGPKYMVLLSIANLKLDIGDSYKNKNELKSKVNYLSAEHNAKRSLDEKKTYQGALSYIDALFSQHKFEQVIAEYDKWEPYIRNEIDKSEKNLYVKGQLEYALSNCLLNRKKIAKKIYDEASIYTSKNNDQLTDLEVCLGEPILN